ncbi:MAG: hypothetical protein ACLFMP_04080 [Desulfonatronovibrionaceae bacterium]
MVAFNWLTAYLSPPSAINLARSRQLGAAVWVVPAPKNETMAAPSTERITIVPTIYISTAPDWEDLDTIFAS